MYHNEGQVGPTILGFLLGHPDTETLKREGVFLKSKLAPNSKYETTRESVKWSVKTRGLGYIDIFLLHSRYSGKTQGLESWRAFEVVTQDGDIKTVGVSVSWH